jgi:PAS domain S-box-containing protein
MGINESQKRTKSMLPTEAGLEPDEMGALWRSLADGLFFKDLDGGREMLTPRLFHLLRMTPEELVGGWNAFVERIIPEERPKFDRLVQAQLATGEAFVVELGFRRGDGQPAQFVIRSEALLNPDGRVRAILGSVRDITPRRVAEQILVERQTVAEMIAADRPLAETLTFLAESLDRHLPGCVSSILLADMEKGVVCDGAGPGLPEVFRKAINGLPLGPKAGSCGTALFRGEPVVVEDIATDPLWEDYRDLALPLGLRSCWSHPIRSSSGESLGTFAVYGRTPRRPDAGEIDLVGRAGDLAGVAIQRAREQAILRRQIDLLEAADERFNMVVRASRTGFWDWDIRNNSMILSDEWKAQLGYLPHELTSGFSTWEDHLHPDDREAALSKVRNALIDPSRPFQSDFRLRHKDGSYRWILAQGRVIADEDGDAIRMIGTHVDVSEVKRAQDEMLRQGRLLELSQAAARVGGWDLDPATGTMFWTAEAYRLHDVAPESFNPSIEAELLFHPPESRERFRQIVAAAIATGQSWDEEFLISTARGRQVWLRSTGQPLLVSGRAVKLFGTWQDVTDWRHTQAALRQSASVLRAVARVAQLLLSAEAWTSVSTDALAIIGEGADASRVRLFKLDEVGEMEAYLRQVGLWIAPGVQDSASPQSFARHAFGRGPLARWQRQLESDTPIHGPVAALPSAEQQDPLLSGVLSFATFPVFRERMLWGFLMLDDSRTARLWSTPELHALQTAAGLFGEAISRAHELAERARFQQKLQESQKLETLGVLAGGIAHDFNNLLTCVLGNATIARAHLTEPQEIDYHLHSIENAARRAAELCQQMLAYAGKDRVEIALQDLNAIVSDISRIVLGSISKKIDVLPELTPNLPPVHADAVQMRQVILNLLLNAADAMGENDGTIILRTSVVQATARLFDGAVSAPEQPAARYVSLEVADNGSGMAPETLARIFDPFFTTRFTGRGLGLAAVLGIVRSHHGGIFVASKEHVGTTFRMLLPAAEKAPALAPAPSAPTPAFTSPAGSLVLVIDDEQAIRQLTTQMLRRMGFDSVSAGDGEAGLEVFKEHSDQIRLVVLDLAMPRMDGATTLGELRRLRPGIPIVLMSGYSEDDAVGRFAGLPNTRFMQKPFGLQHLQERIGSLIGRTA